MSSSECEIQGFQFIFTIASYTGTVRFTSVFGAFTIYERTFSPFHTNTLKFLPQGSKKNTMEFFIAPTKLKKRPLIISIM